MNSMELEQFLNSQIEANPFLDFDENYIQADNSNKFYSNDSQDENLSSKPSLKEFLYDQIPLLFSDNKDRIAAIILTDALDDNGYFEIGRRALAEQLCCDINYLDNLIRTLQTAEPTGVYCENLKECLSLQLHEKKIWNEQFALLLDNLDLLAHGELTQLCKKLKIDNTALNELILLLKTLDPKPGRRYSSENTQTKIADTVIVKDITGKYICMLNDNSYSNIILNNQLYQSFKKSPSKDDKEFCSKLFKEANFLYKSINQRSSTILKLTKLIAEEQYEFFEYGIKYLKPMKLSDAAQKLGFHESTISRANNKLVATPKGVLELGYFFSNGLQSNISDDVFSSKSIKNMIEELVKEEKENCVLSDDEISEALQNKGIKISRRTVAKYREALQIPPSNIRKRLSRI